MKNGFTKSTQILIKCSKNTVLTFHNILISYVKRQYLSNILIDIWQDIKLLESGISFLSLKLQL